jgi:hypothetical protein
MLLEYDRLLARIHAGALVYKSTIFATDNDQIHIIDLDRSEPYPRLYVLHVDVADEFLAMCRANGVDTIAQVDFLLAESEAYQKGRWVYYV